MLTLKSLKFKGIGRFVEEQVVDFECVGKIIQVDGQNNNTGGSSGAGKSTVFNALDYLFGLNKSPSSVLQSRLTEDHIQVEGHFDLDGKSLTISRGKKLRIDLDGEVTTGSSKISEEKLDQIIAMPRTLFGLILHKKQGAKGFFLELTPKETNDFLTDCLGHQNVKAKASKVDAHLSDLARKSAETSSLHLGAESALRASQDALGSIGSEPATDVTTTTVEAFKATLDECEAHLAMTKARHSTESDMLSKRRPSLDTSAFDSSTLDAINLEISDLRSTISQLALQEKDRVSGIKQQVSDLRAKIVSINTHMSKVDAAQKEAVTLAAEIKKVRDSICPTCEQSWLTDSIKSKESNLMARMLALRDIIRTGNAACESLPEFTERLFSLEPQVKESIPAGSVELSIQIQTLLAKLDEEKKKANEFNDVKNKSNKEKLDKFSECQSKLSAAHTKEIADLTPHLNSTREEYVFAKSKLESHASSLARYLSSKETLTKQIAKYQSDMDKLSGLVSDLKDKLEMTEELKRAAKSFLSRSFDEALETIGENATNMIRNIPNMANATIQLCGTKESQDGKVKDEVVALIHSDGEQNIDIRSLSGGERASVDLAIDLSVLDFIEDRSGRGISLYSLDEPFNGLDSINSEAILNMLINSGSSKKIIVVDHNDVTKQMVQDKILVVRDMDTSKIVQNKA